MCLLLPANVMSTDGHTADKVSAQTIKDLDHKVAVLERVFEAKVGIVDRLRTRYSAAVCSSKVQRDKYIAIQRRIASACRELAQANEEEVHFFDDLNAAGVTPYFRPMRVGAVG